MLESVEARTFARNSEHVTEFQWTRKPKYRYYTLEVVSQRMQAHFSAHIGKPTSQEVGVAHPMFERREHVLTAGLHTVIISGILSSFHSAASSTDSCS
ncbi:hypothetical protein [Burkholderia sp. Nafp2/4-1b]|uniref:hypothetical protein n=1 Tax=Burkholderia sp. Nafp2/4-1b TaxID=2116686 RepID=UPI0013CE7832|nr:hypothetical protein [Burkholderia sp. Nafp2/4-1b]